jgi:hypothetical protein
MKSLFNAADNAAFVTRIAALTPEHNPQWGKMNVGQMVVHCQRPLQVAFGELKLKRTLIGMLFGGLAKRKLAQDKPWDRNMPTDRHFKIAPLNHDLEAEKQILIALVRRFAAEGPGAITQDPHPFFGKLTPREWDTLQSNHLHHHLSQFGV